MKSLQGLLVMVTLLLGACGLDKPVKLPRQVFYTIKTNCLIKPPNSKARDIILLSMPMASPGYQSSRMVYMKVPYQLNTFANSYWIAPPAQMLLPVLAQQLRSYRYFKAVLTSPFSGIIDYRLDMHLLALQQEFMQPISVVRLVMQATLINAVTGHVISARRFFIIVNAPGNNPYSGVLAANRASASLAQAISRFVLQSIHPRLRFLKSDC